MGNSNQTPKYDWRTYEKTKIGSGTYGKVYEVKVDDGTLYAMKVPKKHKKSFLETEAFILKKLQSICGKHILCFKDFVQYDDGSMFLITEFLDGYKTLTDYSILKGVDRKKRNQMVYNAVEAVAQMHRAGVAHLDLSMQNIMVNPDTGNVKIIDFGSSCADTIKCHVATMSNPVDIYNYKYYSPEYQRRSSMNADDFTLEEAKLEDIYMLGVLLLSLATPTDLQEWSVNIKSMLSDKPKERKLPKPKLI